MLIFRWQDGTVMQSSHWFRNSKISIFAVLGTKETNNCIMGVYFTKFALLKRFPQRVAQKFSRCWVLDKCQNVFKLLSFRRIQSSGLNNHILNAFCIETPLLFFLSKLNNLLFHRDRSEGAFGSATWKFVNHLGIFAGYGSYSWEKYLPSAVNRKTKLCCEAC